MSNTNWNWNVFLPCSYWNIFGSQNLEGKVRKRRFLLKLTVTSARSYQIRWVENQKKKTIKRKSTTECFSGRFRFVYSSAQNCNSKGKISLPQVFLIDKIKWNEIIMVVEFMKSHRPRFWNAQFVSDSTRPNMNEKELVGTAVGGALRSSGTFRF